MMQSVLQRTRKYDVHLCTSPGLGCFTRLPCSDSVPVNCGNTSSSSRQSIFDLEVALSVFMLQNEKFFG